MYYDVLLFSFVNANDDQPVHEFHKFNLSWQ